MIETTFTQWGQAAHMDRLRGSQINPVQPAFRIVVRDIVGESKRQLPIRKLCWPPGVSICKIISDYIYINIILYV